MFVEGHWHVEVCSEAKVNRTEPFLCVDPLPPSCPIFQIFDLSPKQKVDDDVYSDESFEGDTFIELK